MLPRVPFVSFVLVLMFGIAAGDFLAASNRVDSILTSYIETAVILVIIAVSFWFYQKRKYSGFSLGCSLFLFFSGMLCINLHHQNLLSDINKLTSNQYDAYEAEVRSLPEKRTKSLRLEVSVKRIHSNNKWITANVKAYLSIPLDASTIPAANDFLIVNGNLQQPRFPMNPEEFDYKRYLWNKGIVWTSYLPDGSFQVIKNTNISGNVKVWSIRISEWADQQFRANLKDDKSYGLVKAMLLGRRDDLRSDQIDDYTTSGTVHILSVSGMHVAIIFLVLSYMLSWLKKLKGGKYIYLLTIISLLCFYALVTGLPPSVQRATLMCIVFVVAEVFSRKHNSMNTLALSAFLILIVDPQAFFDVGFRLSYLAMAGIFLLYTPIYSIFSPSNILLKYTWQITALSLAAQLTTFPLSLYYFHQFPFYFWLVNPFVITFTNALLPAALLLLFVCLMPWPWLHFAIGWIVDFFSYLTNISVGVPKALPGYLIENLYLNRLEVILLYGVLLIFWYAYESREYTWMKYGVGSMLFFVMYSLSLSIQMYLTPKGVIHAIPKHNVMSFKEGNALYISSDEAFEKDTNAYKFYIKNYAIREGVTEIIFLNKNITTENLAIRSCSTGDIFFWNKSTIYKGEYISTQARLDYHLITSLRYPKIKKVKSAPETTFLLSGEIKKRTQECWLSLFVSGNIKHHDLLSQGFVLLP
jgi:competence protein ComEC